MPVPNYCPNCREVWTLGNAKCSKCGAPNPDKSSASTNTSSAGYPTRNDLLNTLTAMIDAAPMDRRHKMPPEPARAAEWWLRCQKPMSKDSEAPRSAKGSGWEWPYAERVQHNLHLFLRSSQRLQQLVFDARKDGIYWAGERYEPFLRVIAATTAMREAGQIPGQQDIEGSCAQAFTPMSDALVKAKPRRAMTEEERAAVEEKKALEEFARDYHRRNRTQSQQMTTGRTA